MKVFTDNWVDAQERHQENPAIFWAPSQEELNEIKKGFSVKICNGRERFWVNVVNVNENKLIGIVANELIYETPYNNGDKVSFFKKNIYQINSPRDIQFIIAEFEHAKNNPNYEPILNETKVLLNIYRKTLENNNIP